MSMASISRPCSTMNGLTSVFVPTTPNPTSGFFLMVPRKDVVELGMSVDDGLKMLLSMGVVVPGEKNARSAAPLPKPR